MTELEHVNFTVRDPLVTADWMTKVFGWSIRWEGPSADGSGYMVHVGSDRSYVSLYRERAPNGRPDRFGKTGGLNHIAVVTDDISAMKQRVQKYFEPTETQDYEPGLRFYFFDDNQIEYEVVSYP